MACRKYNVDLLNRSGQDKSQYKNMKISRSKGSLAKNVLPIIIRRPIIFGTLALCLMSGLTYGQDGTAHSSCNACPIHSLKTLDIKSCPHR